MLLSSRLLRRPGVFMMLREELLEGVDETPVVAGLDEKDEVVEEVVEALVFLILLQKSGQL